MIIHSSQLTTNLEKKQRKWLSTHGMLTEYNPVEEACIVSWEPRTKLSVITCSGANAGVAINTLMGLVKDKIFERTLVIENGQRTQDVL